MVKNLCKHKAAGSCAKNLKKQRDPETLSRLDIALSNRPSISSSNTLDIIEALVEMEVFSDNSGTLLKEAVSFIYRLRINLHQHYSEHKEDAYSEHKEDAYLQGLSVYILKNREKQQLEKIYWLILRPLYHNCLTQVLEKKVPVETVFSQTDLIIS